MMMFMWLFFMSGVMASVVMVLGYVLSFSGSMNFDKLSPFECGFNPNVGFRVMFSLHFFLISLIFLVFDLELVILFPYLVVLSSGLEGYLICMLFVFVLGLGLVYEWGVKSLEWCL